MTNCCGARGISCYQESDPDLAAGLGLSRDWGVVISNVAPRGPAEAAGLRLQDVVYQINRQPVASVQQVRSLLQPIRPAQPVVLQIERAGQLAETKRTRPISLHKLYPAILFTTRKRPTTGPVLFGRSLSAKYDGSQKYPLSNQPRRLSGARSDR